MTIRRVKRLAMARPTLPYYKHIGTPDVVNDLNM